MRVFLLAAGIAVLAVPSQAATAPGPEASEAMRLLEEALVLAREAPSAAERADAVGRVAAEIARVDPKRALEIVAGELETHEQSLAIASAAETIARDNRLLGFATLLRINDLSTVVVALARVVAMEALVDFDEAKEATDQIELLTTRRIVERDVTRVIWADVADDRAAAVEVAVRWAEAIDDLVTRNDALALAAEGAAGVDPRRAEEIASQITDVEPRDLAWRLMIEQVARRDPSGAQALLGGIQTPLQRNLAGAAVVSGLAAAGRGDEALALAREVRVSATDEIEHLLDRGAILEELAVGIVDLDPTMALSIIADIWPSAHRYIVQCRLARHASLGDAARRRELLEDAWVEVRRTDSPLIQRQVTSAVLASATLVAPELVQSMAGKRPELVQESLPAACLAVAADDPEAALVLADRIADVRLREGARSAIVQAAAGDHEELARRVAEGLTLPGPKSAALVALAVAVAGPDRVD